MQQKKLEINLTTDEERFVSVMSLLGDKTRFKIFKIMQSGREMCVSEIAGALNLSVPAISQHFKIFEQAGMVEKQRYGQKICYRLRSDDRLLNSITNI